LLEKRKETKIVNQPAVKIKIAGGKTVTFWFILQNFLDLTDYATSIEYQYDDTKDDYKVTVA